MPAKPKNATRVVIVTKHSSVSVTVRDGHPGTLGRALGMHDRYALRDEPIAVRTQLPGGVALAIRRI